MSIGQRGVPQMSIANPAGLPVDNNQEAPVTQVDLMKMLQKLQADMAKLQAEGAKKEKEMNDKFAKKEKDMDDKLAKMEADKKETDDKLTKMEADKKETDDKLAADKEETDARFAKMEKEMEERERRLRNSALLGAVPGGLLGGAVAGLIVAFLPPSAPIVLPLFVAGFGVAGSAVAYELDRRDICSASRGVSKVVAGIRHGKSHRNPNQPVRHATATTAHYPRYSERA
ncbi:MAG: hypothetical protein LBK24_02125 [Puniceicoccales bacterium]|nr:hypothetical protein [Puniceicoccales bacterium]